MSTSFNCGKNYILSPKNQQERIHKLKSTKKMKDVRGETLLIYRPH